MPSHYKLPKVNGGMGRKSYHATAFGHSFKFYLREISINRQGYDKQGAYWGPGEPLFMAEAIADSVPDGETTPSFFFRAETRDKARVHVLTIYPNARFFKS